MLSGVRRSQTKHRRGVNASGFGRSYCLVLASLPANCRRSRQTEPGSEKQPFDGCFYADLSPIGSDLLKVSRGFRGPAEDLSVTQEEVHVLLGAFPS